MEWVGSSQKIRSTGGRYVSYWNAFLLLLFYVVVLLEADNYFVKERKSYQVLFDDVFVYEVSGRVEQYSSV